MSAPSSPSVAATSAASSRLRCAIAASSASARRSATPTVAAPACATRGQTDQRSDGEPGRSRACRVSSTVAASACGFVEVALDQADQRGDARRRRRRLRRADAARCPAAALSRHDLDDALGVDPRAFGRRRELDRWRRSVLASLVSLTDGRACRPTSWVDAAPSLSALGVIVSPPLMPATALRPCAATSSSDGAAGGFGRRHHRALDDRRIADDDRAVRARRQHLDRHLAVGLGAAEIDQDGDAGVRPGLVDRRQDRLDAGAEAASGLPPHQASGTSSPTICRTMSAAPRATSGECETMTMPTLLLMPVPSMTSQTAAIISCARARARIHVADRALAEERGAAADRLHRHGRRRGSPARWRSAAGRSRAAGAASSCTGTSTSSIVFWPTSDLPRAFDRVDRRGRSAAARSRAVGTAGERPCRGS